MREEVKGTMNRQGTEKQKNLGARASASRRQDQPATQTSGSAGEGSDVHRSWRIQLCVEDTFS